MFSNLFRTLFFFSVLISVLPITVSQYVNITIPLNKTITLKDKELYGDFYTIKSNSTIQVNLENVTKKVSFIIFQVHSHLFNITLYNNTRTPGSTISGTNVGLYSPVKPALYTFYVSNENVNDLKVYISIHGYFNADPIPGGANMEFPVYISPFMYVKYNKDYISVDAQSALPFRTGSASVTFYRMYLLERDFSADSYFEGIRNMMTLKNIEENGSELPQANVYPLMRRYLSAYPGTGSIYVAVARSDLKSDLYSVYVPTYTYACSPLEEHSCDSLDDVLSQLFCAMLLFIGVFTCFFGHRFFKTEMFLAGMFFGFIVTYILISILRDIEIPALVGASLLSGVFFGAIWLLFWWFYGIPVAAVLMATLHLGFLAAAIIYYRLPGGILEQNGNFWTLFILVMLLTSLTLVTATFLSNILCCAVLGAYAVVFSLDHYVGSNLKYIFINTVRRAVNDKFRFVVVSPPFQWRDIILTLLWVMLAVSGVLFQHYHNRGRPPFPPPPRSIGSIMPELPSYVRRIRNRRYGAIEEDAASVPDESDKVSVAPDERTPLM